MDPEKLAAVKEATFCKYPCGPNLVDITWRKECITAIDSGLRNEARAQTMSQVMTKSEGPSHNGNSVSGIVNSDNILSTTVAEMQHQQHQQHQQQQQQQQQQQHHLTQNTHHQIIGNQSQTDSID